MPIPKNYDAKSHEDKIYKEWEDSGAFQPKEDCEEHYSIMMPPPNATGQLHLGHASMLAIEDIMIRFNRMQGKSTLWLPGTDHAGIATQNKVEKVFLAKGITRHDLGREKFVEEIKDYVKGSQDRIRNQVRKMGSSCDWSRERYTLDEGLSDVVKTVFVRMHEDGIIYQGHRIVNWCPRCSSTLADDEVDHSETEATLYYMQYGPFVVATSRPETKLGDTAVAVNPNDERYKEYIGQTMNINFGDHKITVKVIADEHIDPEFGTGVLGVTPAHSFTDYEMAKKHDVEVIQVINEEGRMTQVAGKYKDLTVLEAREAFVKELKELGLLIKTEKYKQNLSVCYRCDTPIEPLISKQWFIDVNKKTVDWHGSKKSLQEILAAVINDKEIEIIPKRFEKSYFGWVDNLQDWCISRQIWFGHRIPAWYKDGETKVQAMSPGEGWEQDHDTLDTWFSSGMWTFSTLGWPEATQDFKRFHPTNILETGYDILTFWIIRMIIMTTYATGETPFKQVYLHGLVRDKNNQKMSKSKGNGIDPLEMIEKYGTDALRLSLVIGTSPGNDVKLYEEKIANYRNFVTKLWNVARFALMNIDPSKMPFDEIKADDAYNLADKWILSRTQDTIKSVTKSLKNNHLSEAGSTIYNFLWNEFANWYLEINKVEKNEKVLYYVLSTILKLMHPFTPFVTEVLWDSLKQNENLITTAWPKAQKDLIHEKNEKEMEKLIETVTTIRSLKADFNLKSRTDLEITIVDKEARQYLKANLDIIKSLAKLKQINLIHEDTEIENTAVSIIDSSLKIHLHLEGTVDLEAEITKAKKEIAKFEQYIEHQNKKLSNEKFISQAPPAVIEKVKNTIQESQGKIDEIQNRLNTLI